MALQPVARQSLPDAVFEQLVDGIVAGDFEVGATLPSERRLAEALGVSRPAVREALQRLAQSGLVTTRQGDGTTVREWQRAAGPELLPRLLLRDGEIDLGVTRAVVEARAAIGPEAARLAATRASAEVDARLRHHLDALAATDDAVELQRVALDFWDTVIDASDNIAFRLMLNALTTAYAPVMDAMAVVMAAEVRDRRAYAAVAEAVADRDPDRARDAAATLLRPGTDRLVAAIDELLENDDDD